MAGSLQNERENLHKCYGEPIDKKYQQSLDSNLQSRKSSLLYGL